jgi:toxin YoeB
MDIVWSSRAWKQYLGWKDDKQTWEKINDLIKAIMRGQRMGKAEILRHSDYLSCRITHADRLVYKVQDGKIYIASCKGHYEE